MSDDAPVRPTASRLTPLGLSDVRLAPGPWADWQRDNRTVTTPHAFDWLERDGAIDAFDRSLPRRSLWFSDSDVYKALEAVAWNGSEPPADVVAAIASCQEPDGYLNSFAKTRWTGMATSHELYCIGHLIQAGIAEHRRAAEGSLFEVAVKAADCVVRDFGDDRRPESDGHPEIEMALVELYRETGDRRYLDLAKQFVDGRGQRLLADPDGRFDFAYYQDATPIREETTVVGHAVRAVYLLAGIADLYLETGDVSYLDSAVRQWESMTATRTYLNGALGSRFDGERFGDAYELPPDLVYGETCATIGNIMVSWRLLLATGESRFADAIERALFNLFAASTSIERTAFFYNNPAQCRTARPAAPLNERPVRAEAPGTRPVWFECACCPPNIMRTIATLPGYLATVDPDGVQIHQYVASHLTTPWGSLDLVTEYPLDGLVRITVNQETAARWTLSLRRPAWARDLLVNGQPVDAEGYVEIDRLWHDGDVIEVMIPMAARLTVSHPSVDAVRGAVAIERGPVVYCVEGVDQDHRVDLDRVELLAGNPLRESSFEVKGVGTVAVVARALLRDDSAWAGEPWRTLTDSPEVSGEEVDLIAIPYALWANRGPSPMRIFLPWRIGSCTVTSGSLTSTDS